jgi:hypothetical protein
VTEQRDETADLMAWFEDDLGDGEWVNQTWLLPIGETEGRLVDIVRPNGRHRAMLRLDAPGDISTHRWDDLDYEGVQEIADEIKARLQVGGSPVWEFSGAATSLPGSLPGSVLANDCEQLISRAAHLGRPEIDRLVEAENERSHLLPAIWDLLRDQLDRAGFREARFDARRRSWHAVNQSLIALGFERVVDDGYWRVTPQAGAGAARAARYAACALVSLPSVDLEVVDALLAPWRAAVGDPFAATGTGQ